MAPKVGGVSSQPRERQLAFIVVSDQSAIKDPARQQLARTQAIKNSLQDKRRRLQLTNDNFVQEKPNDTGRRRKAREIEDDEDVVELPRRSAAFESGKVDPFETLAIDTSRLATLLRHSSARQAGEPVFSVNHPSDYQGLRSVFSAGIEDPALAFAICLKLALAANGGKLDEECSAYKLKAIQWVNARISNPAEAASTTTVGAVLLLVGVAGCLGDRSTAQIHLGGIRQLLVLCNQRGVYLNHALKRAVFWQDLFTSMIAGTDRVLSHETFPEMHWHRDPYQGNLYAIPSGFATVADVLGQDFLEIIGDICALQRLRESGTNYPIDSLEVEKVDNQQAWIESRLEQLRRTALHPLLLCCIPAAYLCGYGFFAEVWSATLIPSNLSAQLLRELQDCESWEGWDEHAELLLWLLNIGAAFATDVPVRLGFAGLWHGSHRRRLEPISQSWYDVEKHLKRFIWSDIVYGPRCGAFWERLQSL